MKETFKNITKLGFYFFGISLAIISCQKDDDHVVNEQQNLNNDYRVVSLEEIPSLIPVVDNVKRVRPKSSKANRDGVDFIGLSNVNVEEIVKITNETGKSTYSFSIDNPNDSSINFENLHLVEVEGGYLAYILNYEIDEELNNFILTPEGDFVLDMNTYQGQITKYSLEREVIWTSTMSSNSTVARVTCTISMVPMCDYLYMHPRGLSCTGNLTYEPKESCVDSGGGGGGDGSAGGGGPADGDSSDELPPCIPGADGTNTEPLSGSFVSNEGEVSEETSSECVENDVIAVNPDTEEEDDDCNTSKEDLKKVFPSMSDADAELLASIINDKGQDFGINSDEDLWHFLSQAGHETGGFNTLNVTESTYWTTASKLAGTYSRFTMDSIQASTNANKYYAPDYLQNSSGVANVAMCCKFGNGNVASGDGYKYRGRGLFQLTWKSNYQSFKTWYNNKYTSNIDPVGSPGILATNDTLSVLSGLWYYKTRVVDKITIDSLTTVDKVTIKINGKAKKGIADRKVKFKKAKDSINCL